MKHLVLDVGNSTLFVGVFAGARLVTSFRVPVRTAATARGFAHHIATRVRQHGRFDRIALCSVVPALTPKILRHAASLCDVAPPRVLTFDAPHGLRLGYRVPAQLGADRLAAALGARALFPKKNLVVVDCGTATTVTALHRDGTLLGGAILPGLGLWPAMLASRTAQLPPVTLARPRAALGRSTVEGLQSGIFHGHAGAIRELVTRIRAEAFGRAAAVVIGTGGHAARFATKRDQLFHTVAPHLVLQGLHHFCAAP